MIDTHTHLDFPEFDNDRKETIKRFFSSGGEKIINVGCDLESSRRSCVLAAENKNIFASVGIHPHEADTVNKHSLKKLEELACQSKVVAVGEIGLDYFRNLSPKKKQIEAFKFQLEIAENHKMPIIIHCRDAYDDLLSILKEYKISNWKGVVHCFTAGVKIAKEFLNLGFYIGFTGIITYYNNKSESGSEPEIYKVIKNAPLDKILLETDCPYISPVPHRGERNEPLFTRYIAEKIAEIKNIDVDKIKSATSKNAERLFGI